MEPNKKIVVIHDEASVQEVVRGYLEKDHNLVYAAGNGQPVCATSILRVLVRPSRDQPRNQEGERGHGCHDEGRCNQNDGYRPPRERRVVVANGREEAPGRASHSTVPAAGGWWRHDERFVRTSRAR